MAWDTVKNTAESGGLQIWFYRRQAWLELTSTVPARGNHGAQLDSPAPGRTQRNAEEVSGK